ncbi:MAG: hypothetical protein SFH39_00415 [Candidatus Magnetobacterium sp. LHC-1]
MYFKASTKFVATDKLFREYILKTRPNVCEWCKQEKEVEVAHILPKGSFIKMRYQADNVLLLCNYCHGKWHDNPLDAADWLKEYKGAGYKDNLKIKNRLIPHKPDLKMMRVYFTQELDRLTN